MYFKSDSLHGRKNYFLQDIALDDHHTDKHKLAQHPCGNLPTVPPTTHPETESCGEDIQDGVVLPEC